MLRKIFKFKAIYIALYILGKGKGQNVARKASIHQFRSPVHNKPIKQEQRKEKDLFNIAPSRRGTKRSNDLFKSTFGILSKGLSLNRMQVVCITMQS